jgi:hypothetical protein
MSASHVLDELRGIHPAALGVEHQQVDIRHEATDIRRRRTVVGLEHGVATHPQQGGLLYRDNDALGTRGCVVGPTMWGP